MKKMNVVVQFENNLIAQVDFPAMTIDATNPIRFDNGIIRFDTDQGYVVIPAHALTYLHFKPVDE